VLLAVPNVSEGRDTETLEASADLYINQLSASADRSAIGLEHARRAFRRASGHDRQRASRLALLEGQALVPTDPKGPLSYGQPRHWDVKGNVLTLTTKGDDGRAVAVGVWQKAP